MSYTPATFDPSTMKGQDFTTASGFDTSQWGDVFGSSFWFSKSPDGLWITSNQASKWPQSGLMTLASGNSAGFGYGIYHFRARSGQKAQGAGINLILWPATGDWFPAAIGSTYGEMDVLEDWSSAGQGTATMHYNSAAPGAAVINGQSFHGFKFTDGTLDDVLHDYEFHWEPGRIALYTDGYMQWEDTSAHVPVDAAHGGMNRTIGAQVVIQTPIEPLPTIQLMLANMWWQPLGVNAAPVTTPVVPVAPVAPVVPPTTPTIGSGSSSGNGGSSAPVQTTPVVVKTPVAPVVSAPVVAAPTTPAAPSLKASVEVGAHNVVLKITKAIGARNTIRLMVDNTYLGVLRDHAADGVMKFTLFLPAPGSHTMTVYLDGSPLEAVVSFTVPGASA